MGAGRGEGRRGIVGAGSAHRLVVEVSGLRDCGRAGGPGDLLWKLHCTVEGERRGERAAGRTGTELCARQRTIDAADHARESRGGAGAAQCVAVKPVDWRGAMAATGFRTLPEIDHAHAPAAALSQVLALRVSCDDSTAGNGPLRVLPGTHARGVLSDDSIHELASQTP